MQSKIATICGVLGVALSGLWGTAAQAQSGELGRNGLHRITDGPGQGTILSVSNGRVVPANNQGTGANGVIESHGGNCDGPHFHGSLRGQNDPNPFACGWGHVALLVMPPSGVTAMQHLAQTARPVVGSSAPRSPILVAQALQQSDAAHASLPPLVFGTPAFQGLDLTQKPR
jgi:hypothetical protein